MLEDHHVVVYDNGHRCNNIYQVADTVGLYRVMENVIGSPEMQFIFPNHDEATKTICPYLFVAMRQCSIRLPTNFGLHHLFRRVLAPATVSSRCDVALVAGLENPTMLKLTSVPMDYHGFAISTSTAASEDYRLMVTCKGCSTDHRRCSLVYPCTRCANFERPCHPADRDVGLRAKQVLKDLVNGALTHNDHAMYQIYLQTQLYRLTSTLDKTEVLDIYRRIGDTAICELPEPKVSELPSGLFEVIRMTSAVKVEWLYDGRYYVATSDDYGANFIAGSDISKLAKTMSVPPKLVDTINLCTPSKALELWIGSVSIPNVIVKYRGKAFWASDKSVCPTTVRMMTAIYRYDYMITVTAVTRAVTMTLK